MSVDAFVGRRIGELRLKAGLDPEVFAQAIGISPAELADYEAGRLRPPAGKLLLIASKLNAPLELLLPNPSDVPQTPTAIPRKET